MISNVRTLIEKLNEPTRKTLEAAAGFCLARTHYDIEVEHFLMKLLDQTDSDLARVLKYFTINKSHFTSELTRSLDKLKSGNARTPSFSPTLMKVFTEAWMLGSIDFGAAQVRTGFCVLALCTHGDLSRLMREFSREWNKIEPEKLQKEFWNIVAGSPEDKLTLMAVDVAGMGAATGAGTAEGMRAKGGKTPNLDQFTVDLTENARKGKIDTVLGRDPEIRQIVDILTRRRQNNPILTGEAGVGKTAVVEGFAMRLVKGDVPPSLRNVTLRSLDLTLMQAGAGIKGEFENRLKGLIEEVKNSPQPIILFIDEAHTMIGAGGAAGQNDAANLLKPALARGELRTIAATTWSEYKKYFEKDAALARRFQVVKVDEPDEVTCQVMLRGLVEALEKHHKVRILDEGVASAVNLSHRYLAGRQLPDKAVSILDTACARLALGQNATPSAIEDLTRQLDDFEVQQRVLERETAVGADHAERLAEIAKRRTAAQARLTELQGRWEKERDLVTRIRDIRTQLEGTAGGAPASAPAAEASAGTGAAAATQTAPDPAGLRTELAALDKELETLQGEEPLMQVCVNSHIVGEVLSAWTGIPVGKMLSDEVQTVIDLPKHLGKRVIGQDHALEIISQRIRASRAALDDPNKPVGVFMLVGPSGVGKTETALALSDLLYGGERNMIGINMSEFQEAHTVSTLKGAPPGYVGYGEGGVLTEAVRRRPYSVVLLDEVEKAHPDVLELFYQVFDKGMMEDGEGREINFKNNIIILTTNAGTDTLMKLVADPETMPSWEGLAKALKPELNKIFKPAFLGRMVIVPFFPVRDEAMKQIIRLKLNKICRRIGENHRINMTYSEAVVEEVNNRCTEVESGARNVDNILTNTLLPDISRYVLTKMAAREKLEGIQVGVSPESKFVYQ